MSDTQKPLLGFIGQGYVGKNYSDDFEERGYTVIRYALEKEYVGNKEKIASADIVFIAVPTPTEGHTFKADTVKEQIPLARKDASVVIKSTLLPGTLEELQKEYPDRYLFHSPEFLSMKTAAHDARHPHRNIIGIPNDSDEYRKRAEEILSILPSAPYSRITTAREAELIKYINNTFFYTKTVFMNLMYELAEKNGCSWETLKEAMEHEPWIANQHLEPIHKSGRGAGGECLIKDFAALQGYYKEITEDETGLEVLKALEQKNIELLKNTNKDVEILEKVYGKSKKVG